MNIAIVGATGAVGQTTLELLAERKHPARNIRLLASKRSHGKTIQYGSSDRLTVSEAQPDSFEDVDVAFISASSEVSKALAPEAVRRGALVIDDGSAFRMEPNVPLVVPEVNPQDVEWHEGIISIPNCVTTPLVMALAALRPLAEIASVTVSTYQSVTGTGAAAKEELITQTAETMNGQAQSAPEIYPHPIAFNLLPHVDDFTSNGYTYEEMKMLNETRKILNHPRLPISATCVRVPVIVSHCESVTVEFDERVGALEAREALARFPGIALIDDPQRFMYPTPRDAEGIDEILIGRVREDIAHRNAIVLWIAADNLRKGAALNALQIVDECVRRDAVRPKVLANS